MAQSPQSESDSTGDGGEVRLGHSPRGQAANEVVLALSRAARSFLLYDPANEAIRIFLDALRDTTESYTAAWGDLSLLVRPFELVLTAAPGSGERGTEVVFLDRDRERSLAFKLFRDGVRRLTIKRDVGWSEVLKLLEVLSIRYIGVRQAEDDLVVLLWKAGFRHVEIEAVEGFVADEEEDETMETQEVGAAEDEEVLDLPMPDLYARVPVRFAAVSAEASALLEAEDGMAAIPDLCLQLTHELITLVEDPADPLCFLDALPQLRELRDFVQTDGQLAVVLEMARRVGSAMIPGKPGQAAPAADVAAFLASFADERSIGHLVRGTDPERPDLPPELVALLQLVPGNHLPALLAVLEHEAGEGKRIARALVERYAREKSERIVEEIQTSPPALANELLRALRYAHPERAVEAARQYALRPPADRDGDVELGCLRAIEGAAVTPTVVKVLTAFVGSVNAETRTGALALVGRRQVQGAFSVVLDRVKREGLRGMTGDEAEAYGAALAGADPELALSTFRDWVRPKGFFSALAPPMLRWVAVSGLVFLPGTEAEDLIRVASEKGGADLQKYCTDCMVRRRRTARTSAAPFGSLTGKRPNP